MWDQLLNTKFIGLVVGLIFGIIVVTVGIWEAFVVAGFALLGWLIAKFWAGEIDFLDSYEGFLSNRRKANHKR